MVAKLTGRVPDYMCASGRVRAPDKNGNDWADLAADFGRRSQSVALLMHVGLT